jgi:hypothetical protein
VKEVVVGGIIVLVLGGSTFAISQTDLVNNFANETGMSQQEAKEYVEESQDDLASFTEIGNLTVQDGKSLLSSASEIDCATYEYEWESPSLSCNAGKSQLSTIGNNEIELGECYVALDTDLNEGVTSKINECMNDIDASTAGYKLPMASIILDSAAIQEVVNANAYNKSVLKATAN